MFTVTRGDQGIFVSTLAVNAKEVLADVLHVKNYPCEEWPNLGI